MTKQTGEVVPVYERLAELNIYSQRTYMDPFNDVEIDVIFSGDGRYWRVPTFWRGGGHWTVRFAPPCPGEYSYRIESSDPSNPDINGQAGRLIVTCYGGVNDVLRHGMLRVSSSKRYFEYEDGTPFYWLGDTWWTGLSDRLSWPGFQKLTADRKAKGFTLIQLVAGLVPFEELAPSDPGFHNEGGYVWSDQFERINPRYFDYADRRIEFLLEHGLVPALVGSWYCALGLMGVTKMKQHWRYIIARYGAYPMFWVVGGEIIDPPEEQMARIPERDRPTIPGGWTEITRYIRATDPYHHPLTVHEAPPPYDFPLQDESLTDFDMFQSGHFGWPSIGVEVSQLDQHYSRTAITKPIVQGEIGYEKLGESHFEDFQRTAFWLSMLNGAAGHSYGANGVWEAYTGDKPLHRIRWSFVSWEEGMGLPGSYQVGLGAKLLRHYDWWHFAPHPEWVVPRGTTLLEPHVQINGYAFGSFEPSAECESADRVAELERTYVSEEWKARQGTFRLPYAAGIPRRVRVVYVPSVGVLPPAAPTILALESDVRYRAYWWEPSSGTQIALGVIARPTPGPLLFESPLAIDALPCERYALDAAIARAVSLVETPHQIEILKGISVTNAVAKVAATGDTEVGLVLRFVSCSQFIAAIYSPKDKSMSLIECRQGSTNSLLARIPIGQLGTTVTLHAEVRGFQAAASVTDGSNSYTTPIIDLSASTTGGAGLLRWAQDSSPIPTGFQVRKGAPVITEEPPQRTLRDARGVHRGELIGQGMALNALRVPGWDALAREKFVLLDAYRPSRLPTAGDWVLVLDAEPEITGLG